MRSLTCWAYAPVVILSKTFMSIKINRLSDTNIILSVTKRRLVVLMNCMVFILASNWEVRDVGPRKLRSYGSNTDNIIQF